MEKKIDMGHARAILASESTEQQLYLYKRILAEGLSVRKVEELAAEPKKEKKASKRPTTFAEQEKELSSIFSRPVKISGNKIVIPFANEKELNNFITTLR